LIGRDENEASRSHSGCDTEQSGEAVKSAGLLLYFIRTKENKVGANEKIMTQRKDRRKKPEI
jgi:hypothetical protein